MSYLYSGAKSLIISSDICREGSKINPNPIDENRNKGFDFFLGRWFYNWDEISGEGTERK